MVFEPNVPVVFVNTQLRGAHASSWILAKFSFRQASMISDPVQYDSIILVTILESRESLYAFLKHSLHPPDVTDVTGTSS